MSPKARQGLVILTASVLVLGVLVGAGIALWRDLGPEERAVLEPVLNPRLGLLIMIGLVGAGAAAVLMKSFAQDSIAAPALLADEIGLLVGTDPSRRLKPSGSPELQRIAEAVNSLADQRQSLQDDVESRIREARLSVEEERNRLAALMSELNQSRRRVQPRWSHPALQQPGGGCSSRRSPMRRARPAAARSSGLGGLSTWFSSAI